MISVVIPVYKKTGLFLKNLKHNLSFMNDLEVIVVNDDPQENIKKHLINLPIILIENKRNLGFGGAVNIGVKKTSNKFIMLLNSDVVLDNDSFKTALQHFKKNKNLFAVSFAQKEKDGSIVGRNIIFWKNGFIQHRSSSNRNPGINAWAEGGTCIIDKEKFSQLGGFDEIYSPFYWEDIDLSYRAWKSGYEVLFDPKIVVEHFHESTISSYFTPKMIKTIAYRNQLIFMWKTVTDRRLFWKHFLFLKPNLLIVFFKGDAQFVKGYFLALQKLPEIFKKRKLQKKSFKYSDQDILDKFHE